MDPVCIDLTLNVWRQMSSGDKGQFVTYQLEQVDTAMTFLEMLDFLNEDLAKRGVEPIAYQHNCRQGICGSCGAVVNGQVHGPRAGRSLCQLLVAEFKNNDVITLEPFRARAFSVVKDLVVDRSSLTRIVASTGYQPPLKKSGKIVASGNTDGDDEVFSRHDLCTSCGACVAACPNAGIALFASSQLDYAASFGMPSPDKTDMVVRMVQTADREGFGGCSNNYECEAACPKDISSSAITELNRQVRKKGFKI